MHTDCPTSATPLLLPFRQVRERDTYARTFPPVPQAAAAAAAAAPPTLAGPARAGSGPPGGAAGATHPDGLDAVLSAAAAQARALFGGEGGATAGAAPLPPPLPKRTTVDAVVVRSSLLGGRVGRGAAIAPPAAHQLGQLTGGADDEHREEPPPRPLMPPPAPLADTIASLLGVSTADAGADHAYIYGCVLEAARAVEAEARAERRAVRQAQRAAAAAAGQGEAAEDAAAAAEDDDAEDVLLDDDDEEGDGRGGERAGVAVGGGGGGKQAVVVAGSGSTPLRRLLAVLRLMISVEFLRGDDDEVAGKAPAATTNRFRKSLNMRRPNELERLRRRRERLIHLSAVEPMVLTAGRLRESALFAYRRFLLESAAAAGGGGVEPAAIAHGGTSGPWVLPPGTDLSGAAASHASLLAALEELRLCEGVRRALAAVPECDAFIGPLDADVAGVTDYFSVIRTPCDLRTVGQRLASAATHLVRQIRGGGGSAPAAMVDEAGAASEGEAAASAAAPDAAAAAAAAAAIAGGPPIAVVTVDGKTLPVKPWRVVADRWAMYDAEQCRDDLLLVGRGAGSSHGMLRIPQLLYLPPPPPPRLSCTDLPQRTSLQCTGLRAARFSRGVPRARGRALRVCRRQPCRRRR